MCPAIGPDRTPDLRANLIIDDGSVDVNWAELVVLNVLCVDWHVDG